MKKNMFDAGFLVKESVTREWFEENSVVHPDYAFKEWRDWLANNPTQVFNPKALFKKVLELASGKSEAAIRNYLHYKPDRNAKNSEETSRLLDAITKSLGIVPPDRVKNSTSKRKGRIALLTELSNLPSQHYHLEVLHGVINQAKKYRYAVSLHQVSIDDFGKDIKNIILSYRPDGIILIRLSPDKKSISYINNEETPIVLINADNRNYGYPIIGNIVAAINTNVEENFRQWVNTIPNREENKEVVIAAMPTEDSHRQKRVDFLSRILLEEKLIPIYFNVKNYTFTQALPLLSKYPNALAYICLSDQIAVGLKHILIAQNQPYENRIIGFDDSRLAELEQITSFGQQLSIIGELAVKALENSFKTSSKSFEMISVEMSFSKRL